MITITRNLARQLRNVFRRACLHRLFCQNAPARAVYGLCHRSADPACHSAAAIRALSSTTRLIQVLRCNRKHARLVENTLASLRELQSVS